MRISSMVRAKICGAAVGLVVTIDAGDDGVAQSHAGDGFGDAQRFFFIGRADRFARRDGAKAAGTRADVAQNHEGCGAMLPAFAHVGAASAFADGVQIEGAHDALQVLIAFAAQEFDAEPFGARVSVRRRRGIRDDVEWGGHG